MDHWSQTRNSTAFFKLEKVELILSTFLLAFFVIFCTTAATRTCMSDLVSSCPCATSVPSVPCMSTLFAIRVLVPLALVVVCGDVIDTLLLLHAWALLAECCPLEEGIWHCTSHYVGVVSSTDMAWNMQVYGKFHDVTQIDRQYNSIVDFVHGEICNPQWLLNYVCWCKHCLVWHWKNIGALKERRHETGTLFSLMMCGN